MKKKLILIFILFSFKIIVAQNNLNKYFFVRVTTDSTFTNLSPAKNIKVYDVRNKQYATELENGLFKIKAKKITKINLQIDNKTILIDFKKESNNKFFEISILKYDKCTSQSQIIFEKGDAFTIYTPNSKKLNIVRIKFPQVIIEDNRVSVIGHEIFNKYISD